MASIRRYKNSDRSTSFVAQVRIAPFRPIARSFATRLAAQAWADETEKSLKAQRDRGADRSDLLFRWLVLSRRCREAQPA